MLPLATKAGQEPKRSTSHSAAMVIPLTSMAGQEYHNLAAILHRKKTCIHRFIEGDHVAPIPATLRAEEQQQREERPYTMDSAGEIHGTASSYRADAQTLQNAKTEKNLQDLLPSYSGAAPEPAPAS
jgi:hypothetical protein